MTRPRVLGIDASRAAQAQPDGTGQYSRLLLQALLAAARDRDDLRFRLYTPAPLPDVIASAPNATTVILPGARAWTHVRLGPASLRDRVDALFVPAHVLPVIHPRRCVVTVHDLGYLHYPATHRTPDRLYLDVSTRWNVREAQRVIVPSRATADDVVQRLRVDETRVRVIPSGLDPAYLQPVTPGRPTERTPYVLTVCTLHPRKNLRRLLSAFSRFRERHPEWTLVVAGRAGWLLEETGLDRDQPGVHWLGYVDQDQLRSLYQHAAVFALPSLFEGFGFPVLEAMASGVPVLTSSTSSLPEVAGDAAILADPLDEAAITAGLDRLATDQALRDRLIRAGRRQVTRFRWEDTAQRTLAVLDEVLDLPPS